VSNFLTFVDLTFYPADRVFGPASVTEEVYEEVKNVALSALTGINGTAFQIFVSFCLNLNYLLEHELHNHCMIIRYSYSFCLWTN